MWGWINNILNVVIPGRKARQTRAQILSIYGEPGAAYEAKYCVTWQIKNDFAWFPATNILINKEFKDLLFQAFTELQANNCHTEIKTYDGCLVIRNTRGTVLISLHSWGMAIDMNASVEKLGQPFTHWSNLFIQIMTKYVYWGGQFQGRKDPMHFSLYGE